jgi:hypothetical protein
MENIIQISKKQPVYNYECLVAFAIDHSNKHRRTLLSKKTVELLCKFVITSKYAITIVNNKHIHVWNNEHNTRKNSVASFKENISTVRMFSVNEDATVLVTTARDNYEMSFFDLVNFKFMYSMMKQEHMVQMHLSNTGRHLIYTSFQDIGVYDILARKDIDSMKNPLDKVYFNVYDLPIGHVIGIRERDDGALVTVRGTYYNLMATTTNLTSLRTVSKHLNTDKKKNMTAIDAKISPDCNYVIVLTGFDNKWIVRIHLETGIALNYVQDAWNPSGIAFFGGCNHSTNTIFILNDNRTVVLMHYGEDQQYTVITHGDVVTGRLSSIQRYKHDDCPFPVVNNAELTAFMQVKRRIKVVKESDYEYVEDYRDIYYMQVGSDSSLDDYIYSPNKKLVNEPCVVFERL